MMIDTKQQPTFEDLELLVKVSELLTLRDLNTVMQQVVDLTKTAVGAQKASLFLLDGQNLDWDYLFTARDLHGMESVRVVSTVMDAGLAGSVYREKQGAIITDTETDDRWHVFPDDVRTVRSAMCVPLMHDGEVLALLTLDHPEPEHFNDYHLRLMTIITNQATVAVSNAQLFRRLAEKQQQMEAVLQSVPDVLFVTDDEGRIVRMNAGAQALLELESPASANGQRLIDFAEKSDVIASLLTGLATMGDDEEGQSFEARSDKRKRDYSVTVSRWNDPNADESDNAGYVIVMHNITTLRDLFRFKDEMMRIVSHDLRSPLAIIDGYNSMIEFDTTDDSPLREYTDAIHRTVGRMNTLLEDLLQIRQIDEQGLNLVSDTVMVDLLIPVHQGTLLAARQKGQTVRRDVQFDESLRGMVDPILLRQAMENFASNAVKYTPEGGEITIRGYTKDDKFFFEVQDTGIGIPPQSLPHLFESFYRVNDRANTSISGAGLGLSLVKSIIERHNGEVWVNSEMGQGSTFGLWVPLR